MTTALDAAQRLALSRPTSRLCAPYLAASSLVFLKPKLKAMVRPLAARLARRHGHHGKSGNAHLSGRFDRHQRRTVRSIPTICSPSFLLPLCIGRWTVEMLLMYSLERLDVLPVDDFGIREGYRVLKSLPEQPKPKALREISKAWSPHRTVAAWYLWRIPRERGNVRAVSEETRR